MKPLYSNVRHTKVAIIRHVLLHNSIHEDNLYYDEVLQHIN